MVVSGLSLEVDSPQNKEREREGTELNHNKTFVDI